MVVKFGMPQKESYRQIMIRIPKQMLANIANTMEEGGYNKKQRSLWVRESIESLLARSDFSNMVAEEFITPGSTISVPLTLTSKLLNLFDESVVLVQERESVITDRSAIIRTAIIQRLLSEKGVQLSIATDYVDS